MNRIPRLTLAILFVLIGITLVFGMIGWWKVYGAGAEPRVADAIYHTLLAFTGDESYIQQPDGPDLNTWIEIARFTGLLTTIYAIFGVTALFLRERIKRLIASWRRNHIVIIGASEFVLDLFKSETITVFDAADAVTDPQSLPRNTLFLPGPIVKSTGTGASLGKPHAVVFGDDETILNVERAKTWLSEMQGGAKKVPHLMLRVEDGTVARDLELLSPDFRSAQLVSRSETIARAVLTSMVPTELALRRGQDYPHLALVGLGSVNLAIAEEAALRCHHPGLAPLRLTIVDLDVERARRRINHERHDLLNFAESGVQLDFVSLDALECCSEGRADHLLTIETNHPITAITVATGNDARNAAIAMRLRQLQTERLCLKAPIFMRSDSLATVSAASVTDMTGGIIPFGGSRLSREDLELERLYHELAKAIHDRWRNSPTVPKTQENAWENMSVYARRSSYRAALSAVEMFYAAGFVPPAGHRLAGLRLEASAANTVLGNDALIHDMSRMEHRRWMVERILEGYRSTDGHRDNEKKRHPRIQPLSDLTPLERDKDEENVKETLHLGIRQFEAAPQEPCWRRLRRIGLVGPLSVDKGYIDAAIDALLGRMCLADSDLEASALEILTPNAPGFDRLATIALARSWMLRTSRPARILLMNAARPQMMDAIAAEHMGGASSADEMRPEDQTAALWSLASKGHHLFTMDCRPAGCSDADLEADRRLYFDTVKSVQRSMMDLADEMVFLRAEGAEWTETAMKAWSAFKRSEGHLL